MKYQEIEKPEQAVMLDLLGENCEAYFENSGWKNGVGLCAINIEDGDGLDRPFAVRGDRGQEYLVSKIRIPEITLNDLRVGDVIKTSRTICYSGSIPTTINKIIEIDDLFLNQLPRWSKKHQLNSLQLITRNKNFTEVVSD